MLLLARRRAGLTQRELAGRTGVAQPTIARIERGRDDPRVSTLQRLLDGCDESVETIAKPGVGVDRTEMRRLLAMSPADRLGSLAAEGQTLDRLASARRGG